MKVSSVPKDEDEQNRREKGLEPIGKILGTSEIRNVPDRNDITIEPKLAIVATFDANKFRKGIDEKAVRAREGKPQDRMAKGTLERLRSVAAVAEREELGGFDLAVLWVIAGAVNRQNEVFLSNRAIASRVGCSHATVGRALAEIEAQAYVIDTKRRHNNSTRRGIELPFVDEENWDFHASYDFLNAVSQTIVDNNLRGAPALLLRGLASLADSCGNVDEPAARITRRSGLKERTITKSRDTLVAAGLVTVEFQAGFNRQNIWALRFPTVDK